MTNDRGTVALRRGPFTRMFLSVTILDALRSRSFHLALVASLAGCTGHTSSTHVAVTPSPAAAAIAEARARSNAAIAAHDTAAIMREWMPDIHVVASTGTQTAGAEANARSMQTQFTRRPDTKWVRTATRITAFAPWDVAAEEGQWVGTWTDPDGPVRIGGTYLAQWRYTDGRWRIQAEVFVPLHCNGGAYCTKRP